MYAVCRETTIMPRIGFLGVPTDAADEATEQLIHGCATAYPDKVLRELDQLQSFMDANKFPEGTDATRILGLFVAQWLNSGRAASSAKGILEDFKRFGVDPWRLDLARARVRRFRLTSGIERMAAGQGRSFKRRLICGMPAVEEIEPASEAEREKQAFWCLVCATGGRPDNVLRIRRVSAGQGYVEIYWGPRKERPNIICRYRYEWTDTPPAWVIARWDRLGEEPWPFPNPRTIAAAVNGWLKRWDLPNLTSTSARESLDRVLRGLTLRGTMNAKDFECLMDHTLDTSLAHYAEGTA